MDQDTRTERRRPRINVQHLRRDLRDADQDRYRLTSELEQQRRVRPSPSNKLLGVMILIAGGLTSALWLTLPGQPTHADRREPAMTPAPPPVERAAARPESLLGSTPPEQFAAVAADADSARAAAEPDTGAAPPFVGPVPRPVPRASATRPRRSVARPLQVDRTSKPQNDRLRPRTTDREATAPRQRPRPLSPGEFGRAASL